MLSGERAYSVCSGPSRHPGKGNHVEKRSGVKFCLSLSPVRIDYISSEWEYEEDDTHNPSDFIKIR